MMPAPMLLGDAVALLLSKAKPVLFCDTCALLDIIRVPFRENPKSSSRVLAAARSVLSRATAGDVVVVIPPPVVDEWRTHSPEVKGEADRHVNRLHDQYEVLRLAGDQTGIVLPPVAMQTCGVSDALLRLSTDLIEASIHISRMPSLSEQILLRDASCTAPANRGKGTKDCILYEHALQVMQDLRRQSFVGPLVLVTSNTNDFCESGANPKEPIRSELAAVNAGFCTEWGWVSNLLV